MRHYDFVVDIKRLFKNYELVSRTYGFSKNIHPNDKEFIIFKKII